MATTNTRTARVVLREGQAALRAAVENFSDSNAWRDDARALLEFAAGGEPDPKDVLPAAVVKKFERAIARRAAGEPIPYITGTTMFDGLELTVRKGAFVPRWTTEGMAQAAARRLARRASPVHVDLATGIGPVALSVAHRVPKASVYGVDLSGRAVDLARLNAEKLGLGNASFLKGDLFSPLPARIRGKVDAVTIHPPYVAAHEVETLPAELKDFEPVTSLTDRSADGLAIVDRVAEDSASWLRPGGWLIVEIGSYLARKAAGVVGRHDFRSVETLPGPLRYTKLVCARR